MNAGYYALIFFDNLWWHFVGTFCGDNLLLHLCDLCLVVADAYEVIPSVYVVGKGPKLV